MMMMMMMINLYRDEPRGNPCRAGPDVEEGPEGPGPQASHHTGASHQTAHILFLANESADDFFIDALLQFTSEIAVK